MIMQIHSASTFPSDCLAGAFWVTQNDGTLSDLRDLQSPLFLLASIRATFSLAAPRVLTLGATAQMKFPLQIGYHFS